MKKRSSKNFESGIQIPVFLGMFIFKEIYHVLIVKLTY